MKHLFKNLLLLFICISRYFYTQNLSSKKYLTVSNQAAELAILINQVIVMRATFDQLGHVLIFLVSLSALF